MNELKTPGGKYGRAFAVNDGGMIVGEADASKPGLPTLWDGDGVPRALSGTVGNATAINRRGDVAGVERDKDGAWRGVLWQNGRRIEWRAPGRRSTLVRGISDAGEVVGFTARVVLIQEEERAVRWKEGIPHELPSLGGASCAAAGMNGSGVIVGWSRTPSGRIHACEWTTTGIRDLGGLGGGASEARAVNSKGVIVGAAEVRSDGWHACVWLRGRVYDLNDLTPGADGTLLAATAIGEAGQIVGTGFDPSRAFLLTPRPGGEVVRELNASGGR
jgi:probable HAF family extracellular repeat protein